MQILETHDDFTGEKLGDFGWTLIGRGTGERIDFASLKELTPDRVLSVLQEKREACCKANQ